MISQKKIDLTVLSRDDAEQELCARMLCHLARQEPLVRVSPKLTAKLNAWRDVTIANAEFPGFREGTWHKIFRGIKSGETDADAPCVFGLDFLRFMGLVGEHVEATGQIFIPRQIALVVMMEVQGKYAALQYVRVQETWWIEPTELGRETLRVRGRIAITAILNFGDYPEVGLPRY
ncbi:MAG: hypothetical protein JWM36_1161 [Hyphomicrobiales bacterium]|nr:hypothetical protein [Hyphomicrobiales bacterium]